MAIGKKGNGFRCALCRRLKCKNCDNASYVRIPVGKSRRQSRAEVLCCGECVRELQEEKNDI